MKLKFSQILFAYLLFSHGLIGNPTVPEPPPKPTGANGPKEYYV